MTPVEKGLLAKVTAPAAGRRSFESQAITTSTIDPDFFVTRRVNLVSSFSKVM